MPFVVGPFQTGNDCQAGDFWEGCPLNRLIVIGDPDEIEPVLTGVSGQMVERENAVGGKSMGVQIAFEPTAGLGREADGDGHINALRVNHISPQHDLPDPSCELVGVVSRGCLCGRDENPVPAGTTGADLAAVRG